MAEVTSVGSLNNYTAGTVIVDTQVEADFAALKTAVNAILTTFANFSIGTGITAATTQTQGQGALTDFVNIVETVANDGDVVTLPSAATVAACIVVHADSGNGGNDLDIYPASGDHILTAVDQLLTLPGIAYRVLFISDGTGWWPIRDPQA